MRRVILAALLALWPALGQAQFATIGPTPPVADNGDRLATTAWVNLFAAGSIPLASGKIFIGSGGNLAVGQTPSGDCTLSLTGVITCTQAAGNFNVIGNISKSGVVIPQTVSAPLTLSGAGLLACPTCVLVSATAHGDSAYAILSTDRYVYTNAAFTAPRTWTLPAANSLTAGTTIWVQDAQNTVTSTNTLTVSRAGADTINIGGTTLLITGAAGGITFTTDGVSNWGVPVQTPSTGGTGRPTLTNHAVIVGAATNPVTQLAVGATGTALLGVTGADPVFGALPIPAPQGRLTLQTATPVMSSTQSAKTTIFYTPYQGNIVPIYDGSIMVPTVVAEISVATTDTAKSPAAIGASKVNDWFVWNDAGTIRIGHGPDWTSDTARSAGTALVMVNGILLNNASITNGPAASRGTYVGTTRSNGSSQLDWIFGAAASGGTAAFFGVWNAYNRVSTGTQVTDSGVAYTYTSATIRQARASAGNQISFVVGLAEDSLNFSYSQRGDTVAVSGAGVGFGAGFDSTSTFAGQRTNIVAPTANVFLGASSNAGVWNSGLGFHVLSANESSDGANANTFNASNLAALSAVIRN